MKRLAKGLGVLGALVAVCGFGRCRYDPVAEIRSFTATPEQVCPGDPVTISWNTLALETSLGSVPPVDPPLPGVPRGASVASEIRGITETTTFEVRVRSGRRRASRNATVEVVPPSGGFLDLQLPGACDRGVARWNAVTDTAKFSSWLVIATVRNLTGRPVRITHEASGVTFDLNPNEETTETHPIAAQALVSGWTGGVLLLGPHEQCPPPGTTVGAGPAPRLPTIRLLLHYRCP